MSRKRHNSFIDGVGGGPVAPTGSAVTNATVAGNIIHARNVRNKAVRDAKIVTDGGSGMTDDVKAAIRRGDVLFQSTDLSYNIRGPIGSASVMVFATFDGLTPEQALFNTRLVGIAEADNIPFNSFENLEGREIAVAMHGTRGTPGSNNKYEAINCGAIVVALPNFTQECSDKRQSAKAVFWELKPPSLDRFLVPVAPEIVNANYVGNPWAKTAQFLMRNADRAQIIAALAATDQAVVQNAVANLPRRLTGGRNPFDPFVMAVLQNSRDVPIAREHADHGVWHCIENRLIDTPDGRVISPLYIINRHMARELRAGQADQVTAAYIDLLIGTAASMAQSVLSNFVVGRALAHCSTEDKQLQLLVSRSVIF